MEVIEYVARCLKTDFNPPLIYFLNVPKVAIFDIDETITRKPSLTELGLLTLRKYSSELDARWKEFVGYLEHKEFELAIRCLVECEIEREKIEEVGWEIYDKVSLTPNTHQAFRKLRELNYEIVLLTGGFDFWVKLFVQRFEERPEWYASKLYYDRQGRLCKVDSLLGKKGKVAEEVILSKRPEVSIVVTDDPEVDRDLLEFAVAHKFPTFVVGRAEDFELCNSSPLIIRSPSFRGDLLKLTKAVDKFEYALYNLDKGIEYIENTRKQLKEIRSLSNELLNGRKEVKNPLVKKLLDFYEQKAKDFNVEDLKEFALTLSLYPKDEEILERIENWLTNRFVEYNF